MGVLLLLVVIMLWAVYDDNAAIFGICFVLAVFVGLYVYVLS